MLLAHEKGARLIVMVGAHFNLTEFLDKNRAGMSSTFLTRLRVGETLIDAKGVSRLYQPGLGRLGMALVRARLPRARRDRGARLARPRQRHRAALAQDQGRLRRLSDAGCSGSALRPCQASALMGYSGRYHAASLAAVFVALAIGILIGIGLADDVVSSASEELEDSLRSDLDEAEARVDDLEAELDQRARLRRAGGPGARRRPP